MLSNSRRPPATSAPSDGSRTITVRDSQPAVDEGSGSDERRAEPAQRSGVLKLRGGPKSRPQVQWTEDVVDNEGAGRKKSKSSSLCTPAVLRIAGDSNVRPSLYV